MAEYTGDDKRKKIGAGYKPKGTVNIDNPPQGGTGLPPKPKERK